MTSTFGLFWLLLVFVFYITLSLPDHRRSTLEHLARSGWGPVAVVAVALLVRLVPVLLLPGGAQYDIESFRLVGQALYQGEDVYTSAAVGRHPYLPFQMYWIGLAYTIAQQTTIPFVPLVKLLPILADAAIVVLIYRAFQRDGDPVQTALFWALLYALQPISILVSAYHGQFDSVTLLLLLLAWFHWHFGRAVNRSAIFLGFAVLNKTWPVLFLPIIVLRLRQVWRQVRYTGFVLVIPVLFSAAYLVLFQGDAEALFGRALTHSGVPGYWGVTVPLQLFSDVPQFQTAYAFIIASNRWVLLVAGLLVVWWSRSKPAIVALTILLLVVFTLTAGMGLQWLLWLVPPALFSRERRWLSIYTVVATVFLTLQLYGFHMYPWAYRVLTPVQVDIMLRVSSIPVWLTIVAWTVSWFSTRRREQIGQREALSAQ